MGKTYEEMKLEVEKAKTELAKLRREIGSRLLLEAFWNLQIDINGRLELLEAGYEAGRKAKPSYLDTDEYYRDDPEKKAKCP